VLTRCSPPPIHRRANSVSRPAPQSTPRSHPPCRHQGHPSAATPRVPWPGPVRASGWTADTPQHATTGRRLPVVRHRIGDRLRYAGLPQGAGERPVEIVPRPTVKRCAAIAWLGRRDHRDLDIGEPVDLTPGAAALKHQPGPGLTRRQDAVDPSRIAADHLSRPARDAVPPALPWPESAASADADPDSWSCDQAAATRRPQDRGATSPAESPRRHGIAIRNRARSRQTGSSSLSAAFQSRSNSAGVKAAYPHTACGFCSTRPPGVASA
jgi:hypothetical protein